MVSFHRFQVVVGGVLGLALLASGCATRTTPGPAARGVRSIEPNQAGIQAASVPAGYGQVWIESDPPGGMVVLNGVPVGPTPQRLTLPVTQRGFVRGEVSIRVRFVANGSGQASASIEERLNGTDRIPSRLRFTPQKAQRIP